MCQHFITKEVGISKECISLAHKRPDVPTKVVTIGTSCYPSGCLRLQKTDHLKCHFKDKLLSERMSQITNGHLKDKLLSERMSQITGGHLKAT